MPKKKKWEDVLDLLPESLKSFVGNELQEVWEEQQAEIDKYKDYADIVENYKPEDLTNAVTYAKTLEDDPTTVFKELGEYLEKQGASPAQILGIQQKLADAAKEEPKNDGSGGAGTITDPRFEQLLNDFNEIKNGYTQIGTYLTQKEQFEQAQAQEKAMNELLDKMEAENKDRFDRDYIMDRMSLGDTPEQALENFHNKLEQWGGGKREPEAPIVLGSGSLPSNKTPVTELSDAQVEDLVANLLDQGSKASN